VYVPPLVHLLSPFGWTSAGTAGTSAPLAPLAAGELALIFLVDATAEVRPRRRTLRRPALTAAWRPAWHASVNGGTLASRQMDEELRPYVARLLHVCHVWMDCLSALLYDHVRRLLLNLARAVAGPLAAPAAVAKFCATLESLAGAMRLSLSLSHTHTHTHLSS
jgi:hypothetical protein